MDVNSNDGETRKCYTSEHITSHHITSLAFKGIDIVSDFMILKNDFVQTTLNLPQNSFGDLAVWSVTGGLSIVTFKEFVDINHSTTS